MPWAKVRPGMEHGFAVVHKAGEVFDATEAELVSFADKLERVAGPVPEAAQGEDSVADDAPGQETAGTPKSGAPKIAIKSRRDVLK
jgi:hypothetical protein